jgi:ubiquinone/menaquinone biosynthesis C-methylase UbiE
MRSHLNDIDKYYNATTLDYRFWTGSRELAMHFGFWDETVRTHGGSLLKMNEVLAGFAGISRADRVLDAGCGLGGSALWLAKTVGCRVVGIDIQRAHLRRAVFWARRRRTAGQAAFLRADFARAPFRERSFHVVWMLESGVHALDREALVREAFRLLADNGRLVIAEYLLANAEPAASAEETGFTRWLNAWVIPRLLTALECQRLLEATGFRRVTIRDVTAQVSPSLKKLGMMTRRWRWLARFLWAARFISREHLGNVEAGISQLDLLSKGLWRYAVITAEKPALTVSRSTCAVSP